MIDQATFRSVMAAYPTGVTIVTAGAGDLLCGMAANSFTSVSLDPPLVLVCSQNGARTAEAAKLSGRFAIHLLGSDQVEAVRDFVGRTPRVSAPCRTRSTSTARPSSTSWIALLVCRLDRIVEAGDHEILIGEVERCERRVRAPLLFHDSKLPRAAAAAGDPDDASAARATTSCSTCPIPSYACSCPVADRSAPDGPGTALGERHARGQIDEATGGAADRRVPRRPARHDLRKGLYLSEDRYFLILLVPALALGVGRRYVLDFLPFIALMLAYEELRGVAHMISPHPYYLPQIDIDKFLFNGTIPTVWLQGKLWNGHVQWWEQVLDVLLHLHFIVPPTILFLVWLWDRARYYRFAIGILVTSYLGALGFALWPAAPPWMASQHHVIPHIAAHLEPHLIGAGRRHEGHLERLVHHRAPLPERLGRGAVAARRLLVHGRADGVLDQPQARPHRDRLRAVRCGSRSSSSASTTSRTR